MRTVIFLFFSWTCFGQVLATHQTEGRGGKSLFYSVSVFPSEETVVVQGALLSLGLSDRVDFLVGPSVSQGLGLRQVSLQTGVLVRLFTLKGGLHLSTIQTIGLPLSLRDQAAPVWFGSLTLNKEVGKRLVVYGGYAETVGFGDCANKLFVTPNANYNFPIGFGVKLWEKWGAYAEYDFHRPTVFGIGFSRSF